MGKIGGVGVRIGKVRLCTPKVEKQPKKRHQRLTGRAKRRYCYNKRFSSNQINTCMNPQPLSKYYHRLIW